MLNSPQNPLVGVSLKRYSLSKLAGKRWQAIGWKDLPLDCLAETEFEFPLGLLCPFRLCRLGEVGSPHGGHYFEKFGNGESYCSQRELRYMLGTRCW